jgi:DNA repair exonuclease SbcCD ATPase subunit
LRTSRSGFAFAPRKGIQARFPLFRINLILSQSSYTLNDFVYVEAGLSMSAATISVDEFMALEQKVLQTVELIKTERNARAEAESARTKAEAARTTAEAERDAAITEAAELRQKLTAADEKLTASTDAQAEIANLQRERAAVRQRVEKMLATMDALL